MAGLSFLSWFRRGASGIAPSGTATLRVDVSGAAGELPIRTWTPADVAGVDPKVFVRADPPPGSTGVAPNVLASVEISPPELPWLLPVPGADGKIRPWLVLVVLTRRPGVSLSPHPSRPLQILRLTSPEAIAELPSLDESWAFAHVSIAGDSPATHDGAVASLLRRGPESVARLVGARRLGPWSDYLACVVPATRAGCEAALHPDRDPSDRPGGAWPPPAGAALELPVFFSFEFSTGEASSFRSLALELTAKPLPATVGYRDLDVSTPRFGLPDSSEGPARIEGALRPVGMGTARFAWTASAALRARLIEANDARSRSLDAPLYGSRVLSAVDPFVRDGWAEQLNLDPGRRAAAGAGARIVRARQESLVAAAWRSLGNDHGAAIQALKQSQLAREVSAVMYAAHVAAFPAARWLQVTRPAHARLLAGAGTTWQAALLSNALPAALSGAFRRIARAGGGVARRAGVPQLSTRVVASLAAVTARPAPPLAVPDRTTTLESIGLPLASASVQRIDAAPGWDPARLASMTARRARLALPRQPARNGGPEPPPGDGKDPPDPPQDPGPLATAKRRFRGAARLHQAFLLENELARPYVDPPPDSTAAADVAARIAAALDPRGAIETRVAERLDRGSTVAESDDPLSGIQAAPEVRWPMFSFLRDLSQELVVPGLHDVPPESLSMFETNTAFVEALMAGLNEEMARELLWREFPLVAGATVLRSFWSEGDVPPMDEWPVAGSLGDAMKGRMPPHSVLLARASLLRSHPETVVLLVRATLGPGGYGLGSDERAPSFSGALDPDVRYFGFDVAPGDLGGDGTAANPGWFVVLQQPPGAPRFVFGDAPEARGGPLTAADMGPGPASEIARRHLEDGYRLAIHARRFFG